MWGYLPNQGYIYSICSSKPSVPTLKEELHTSAKHSYSVCIQRCFIGRSFPCFLNLSSLGVSSIWQVICLPTASSINTTFRLSTQKEMDVVPFNGVSVPHLFSVCHVSFPPLFYASTEAGELLTRVRIFLSHIAQMFVLNQCRLLVIQKDYFCRCSYCFALLSFPLSLSCTWTDCSDFFLFYPPES